MQTVRCPKCGEEVEISQAVAHEVEEEIKKTERVRYEEEMKVRSKKYIDELTEKERLLRELKRRDEERGLEMEKKLSEAEDKIRQEAMKKAADDHRLKDLEKDKKISDMKVQMEEMQRKLQQGSQQTQGEVLELELEQMLRREFPNDKISEVAKGVRGADVVQEVFEKTGKRTGVILWESKNAKWSEGWIDKLREDMRRLTANEAVLVSVELPQEIGTFGFYKGVWVTGRVSMVGLAWALRKNFWEVFKQNRQNVGKKEKAEEVYEYVNSLEFGHRVESIVEAFNNLNEDLEKEKRWFGLKWARQEKEIRKIMDSTAGMYGELQGVTGRALPEIKALESGE